MIDTHKRLLVRLAGATALAASAALVGCGKKEEAPKTAAAPAAASAAPAKPEPLKIAFAYVGPVGDAGWTFAHDLGRKEVEKDLRRAMDRLQTQLIEIGVLQSQLREQAIRDGANESVQPSLFGRDFGT